MTHLMSRIQPPAGDTSAGAFERMAYSVLQSLYPVCSSGLLEQWSESLTRKYQIILSRKGTKEYSGAAFRKQAAVQSTPPRVVEGSTAKTPSQVPAATPASLPTPSRCHIGLAPSDISVPAVEVADFYQHYQPTEKRSNTPSLQVGSASCPPPQITTDGSKYATCNWCQEQHPITMFEAPEEWKYA